MLKRGHCASTLATKNKGGAVTNPRTKDYDTYKELSIEELAQKIGDTAADSALGRLMRIVYEQKVIEQNHKLDLELLDKQADMMKSSNRLIAIATISAALLGAIVGAVLQYKLTQKPEAAIQKTEQSSGVGAPNKVSTSSSPQK